MTWLVVTFLIVVAVLAPLFGTDTRDGRDWTAADTPRSPSGGGTRRFRSRRTPERREVRTTGSRERASAGRAPVACGH